VVDRLAASVCLRSLCVRFGSVALLTDPAVAHAIRSVPNFGVCSGGGFPVSTVHGSAARGDTSHGVILLMTKERRGYSIGRLNLSIRR
jgi:hypothetical protein